MLRLQNRSHVGHLLKHKIKQGYVLLDFWRLKAMLACLPHVTHMIHLTQAWFCPRASAQQYIISKKTSWFSRLTVMLCLCRLHPCRHVQG